MGDQMQSKYDLPENSPNSGPIRVKAIFIHPIKSCAPIELDRGQLTKSGFYLDRFFAFAIEANRPESEGGMIWRFISQRTKPLMSQIKTEVWVQQLENDERDTLAKEARGLDMGNLPSIAAALPKLKRFLNIPDHQKLTLLRLTPDNLVRTEKNLAPLEHIGKPAVHGYTDQQPVNINNLASVHAVSALLPKENQPLNALRFRANIWVTGAPAFDEDTWKRYRIVPKRGQGVSPKLSVVCRTSRCTMPNVNPLTGKFDTDIPDGDKKRGRAQPSSTLVEHRTVEDGNPRALGYLGMHCVPENSCFAEASEKGDGVYVQVGDEVEVLERGAHHYGSTGNDY
ncbi:hypothetical protein ACLX1H_005585 [Fusarium chlamydosporum]